MFVFFPSGNRGKCDSNVHRFDVPSVVVYCITSARVHMNDMALKTVIDGVTFIPMSRVYAFSVAYHVTSLTSARAHILP